MNQYFKVLGLTIGAFVLGLSINNYALSNITSNIAVVDVAEVVSNSAQVKALKKEQETKTKELITFIEKARKDIASTTDVNKKKTLEEKYTKEFTAKKDAQEKVYLEKLAEIDKSVSAQIETAAKAHNYDIVLSKNAVLYGGNDITSEVSKALSK